eukprot:TRINITY_DN29070_c0_g1_i1.p1 TRINITY_DN29070_c0_g1~~TRINITY_DN29070_c0_g1_i1.p1  ORF type:complete len:330 (+),score=62.01 TRINITY_DN29070_c0_g1_i1:149-1138(+)
MSGYTSATPLMGRDQRCFAETWRCLPSVGTWLLPKHKLNLPEAESIPRCQAIRDSKLLLGDLREEVEASPEPAANAVVDVFFPHCTIEDWPYGLRELVWYANVPALVRADSMAFVVQRAQANLRRAMERSKAYRKQLARKYWTPGLASISEGGKNSLFERSFIFSEDSADDWSFLDEATIVASEPCFVEECPDLPGVVPMDDIKPVTRPPVEDVRQVARPLIPTSGRHLPQPRPLQQFQLLPPVPPRPGCLAPPSPPCPPQTAMRRQRPGATRVDYVSSVACTISLNSNNLEAQAGGKPRLADSPGDFNGSCKVLASWLVDMSVQGLEA